ncbi:MAG: DUF2339 domain-containing protein, partial [Rhodobacteraceae bacterium]|nr:DUF2339 domain-containing protein [Paracoccaceae bacterium]
AAVGILGAMLAPFLVGGDPGGAAMLYYFFAVIVVVALAVDTIKRWAWISAFGLILGFAASALVFVDTGGGVHFIAFTFAALIATTIVPERNVLPQHQGATVLDALGLHRLLKVPKPDAPGFPTRLAAMVFAASVLVVGWVYLEDNGLFWLAIAALAGLFALAAIWMRAAPALGDLALLPAIALPLVLVEEAAFGPVWRQWTAAAGREAGVAAPWTLTILLAGGLVLSLIAAWRSWPLARWRLAWAVGAAVFAPLVAGVLEVYWAPSQVIGAWPWAGHVIAIAALMVLLAERAARADGEDRRRAALFTLSALTMMALALILILSKAALTVALAVMVLVAVVLDRQFRLPAVGLFVQAGAALLFWRQVFDPGIDRAMTAPFWEFAWSHAAVLALLFAGRWLLAGQARAKTHAVVDAVFWTLAAVSATILLHRLIEAGYPGRTGSHAAVALLALVWLVSMANQLWRLRDATLSRWLRYVLAGLYAMTGLGMLAAAVLALNPLINASEPAFGPYVVDSLLLAYGLPALFFLGFAIRFDHLGRWLRYIAGGLGIALAALYVGLEIRRLWRGDNLAIGGTTDPELYSYTIAMLIAATSLLFYAFWKRSVWLRKLALAGIGLTVAKVFLIDMSGLTGLTRVFSFLLLGLGLAGLAWLDRWWGTREAATDKAD